MQNNITVSDVIDTQYIDYAMYVLENRAIPCYIDGMKPVQKKLFYSMLNNYKNKKVKIAEIGGGLSSLNYHHGEASAMGAAINMAAAWNNNVPLFEGHGNFGSRLIPEAAAPRYIFATINEDVSKYFTDFEVIDKHTDIDNPEPQTYLPNIPWVLVNGIKGIAVGFACEYLPHLPSDIATACILEANGKLKDDYIIPVTFPGFKGQVIQETETKVVTQGIVNRVKRNQWEITEVPWGYDREQFFKHLEKLQEAGKIQDFDDNCDASGFNFLVKMDTASDKKCQKNPIAYFKLERSFTENYTALDEHGKLKLFDSKVEIIKEFVKFRIGKVNEYLEYEANRIQGTIDWFNAKYNLCADIVNGKLDMRKMNRKDLIDYIKDNITDNTDYQARLVTIPVVDLTQEQMDKLEKQIKGQETELNKVKATNAKDLFVKRLKEIH